MKKKNCVRYGGTDTAEYWCPKCCGKHRKLSPIGKEHWKYRQK